VICGFGRTGNWWGAETYGIEPDTLSTAKQLTSAYAPLGAVLIPERMAEAFEAESAKIGAFGHGFTYGGHPLGCAVGVKAIEIYQKRNIIGHVQSLMPRFAERVTALGDHPLVGETRLGGFVAGIELVADKASKRSFAPTKGVGPRTIQFLETHGAILRAIGDSIAICPPLVITEAEIDLLFDRLEAALNDAEDWVRREGHRAA